MAWNRSQFKQYDTSKGYGNARQWKQSFHERMSAEDAEKILAVDSDSPWGILEVSRTATKEEIKKAFRRLCMKWHPDRNPDDQEKATRMMQKINAAYSLIGES
jgi:DnaJ-class molecular chaperone